jgi:hypothetical protein
MSKQLRVISIGFPFENESVAHASLETDRALFDFDVVVIRPPQFAITTDCNLEAFKILSQMSAFGAHEHLESVVNSKKRELDIFFRQGGVLVVFLVPPDSHRVEQKRYGQTETYTIDNYDFLDRHLAMCLRKGTGSQITYSDPQEPFVNVLKKSAVAWTAYVTRHPDAPLNPIKFFAHAGAGGALAGKMPYEEGHLILLPNVARLDEEAFLEACAEYRFKRQGSTRPKWVERVSPPGVLPIRSEIAKLDEQITNLQNAKQIRERELDDRFAYRKLLYEKGKTQLEPIVLRALDDLGFATSPSEIIRGTNYEIDGRTSNGSTRGIVETKGSKNQIAQSEFAPLVIKLLADSDVSHQFSKGILVGNGLCETEAGGRLGNTVFTPHVLDGAKRNSVALINSVELYWLCCALLRGDNVDKNAVREAILTGNGYVDLKPFAGQSPFTQKG